MKKITSLLLALLSLLLVFSLAACDAQENDTIAPTDTTLETSNEIEAIGLWKNATYRSNATVGNGTKSVTVSILVDGKSVTLTVKTDKDDLGSALYELGIINDASFFDTCNGMKADWNADQAWWAFKQNGTMLNYGVNDAKINGGESFSIEYTK